MTSELARKAARIAIAKVLSPQRWSNLNAGEESRELAAAENLLAAQIAAAHASGVREERERWLSCAQVDATMEGPKLKGWNRSSLDRMWRDA